MQISDAPRRRNLALLALLCAAFFLAANFFAAAMNLSPSAANAQQTPQTQGEDVVDESDAIGENIAAAKKTDGLNLLNLIRKGGLFMIPIFVMSLLVVAFAIERSIGMRRSRVLPTVLITELGQLGDSAKGFDPRKAYRICQQYPSAATTVIRAMLLKVGRPHSEVEHTVAEVSQREAQRMYANVRWLNLAAGVTPLMGLLGTVWGMIRAFHDSTQLLPGQNKADYLAEGIYVALVTTLAGLSVAIPAAMLSHYFEGRVHELFHQIDELLSNLLPQIERYEGRVRFNRHLGEEGEAPKAEDELQRSAAMPK